MDDSPSLPPSSPPSLPPSLDLETMKLYYHNDSSKPVTPVTFNQEEDFVSYLGDEKLVVKAGEVGREGGREGREGGQEGYKPHTPRHLPKR